MPLTRRGLLHTTLFAIAAGTGAQWRGGSSALASQASTDQAGGSNQRLLELASFIPVFAVSDNASRGLELLTFGDTALRLEQVGVDLSAIADPLERATVFARATMPVPLAKMVQASVQATDPEALLGWTILDIEQNASVMSSTVAFTVLRGRFDPAVLQRAWLSQGYETRQVDGIEVASRSADGQIDLTSELGRLTLAAANNAALIGDATLIYASTQEALVSMVSAQRGEVESLGTMPLMQQTIEATPRALAGAMLLPAGAFVAPPEIPATQEDTKVAVPEPGPVPLVGLVGFASGSAVPDSDPGASPEGPIPSGSSQIAVRLFLDDAELDLAAKRSLLTLDTQSNYRTGQPWRELFADWRISIDPAHSAVITDIGLFSNESIWQEVIAARDASYLYG